MKILLVHNPSAGAGKGRGKELLRDLQKAGHSVTHCPVRSDAFRDGLELSWDLVIAAGGDGTIRKVALKLIDKPHCFTALPIGTANNLARTMGFRTDLMDIPAILDCSRGKGVDVGKAVTPWGTEYFLEGIGVGWFAEYLSQAVKAKKLEPARQLQKDRKLLHRHLSQYKGEHWHVRLDGKLLSGHYLFFEMMNIRSIGPRLLLAPEAKVDDGALDFVGVREEHRKDLADYLLHCDGSFNADMPLEVHRFHRAEFHWHGGPMHIDDKPWPRGKKHSGKHDAAMIEVSVQPAALHVLLPEAKPDPS